MRKRRGIRQQRSRVPSTAAVTPDTAGTTEDLVSSSLLFEEVSQQERLATDAFENPGRILIGDGDPELREAAAEILKRQLHTVIQAANGQECLDLAYRRKPDVILLDAQMPLMDGFTVCRRLKADQQLHYVPVILLTEVEDTGSTTLALECGANDFLTKPVNSLDLIARVRASLKYRRALLALKEHQTELERRVEERTAKLLEATERLRQETGQRRQAQELLENERALLRTVIDNMPDAVFLKDAEGRFLVANQRVVVDMGVKSQDEILGKTDFDLHPHAEAVRFYAAEQEILKTGQAVLGREFEQTCPDGRRVHTSTTKLPLRDKSGKVTGLLGIQRNITTQKKAELALAAERATLRTMLDCLPDRVFLKDLHGRFVMCNQQVVTGFNASSMTEVLGKTDFDFYPNSVAEQFFEEDQQVLQSGHAIVNKEDVRKDDHDGRLRAFLITKVPLRGPDGKVTGLLGISRDVSEYKQLEQQLRQAQKMEAVGQLAGGIAHDFNNMLMVILGYAECLQAAPELSSACKEQVGSIHHAAQRAARLTRQLLAFSHRQVLRPETVYLNTVLTDMEQMLQRLIGEHIQMETVLSEDLNPVRADAGQIEQVIMNLALNARDAMPKGGRLVLETTNLTLSSSNKAYHGIPPGRYVVLKVTDTGHGMDRETQAHLFEPFFTTKPFGKGTGLGLSVVYGVVKQSGGHILFQSEVNRGTTFTILLPPIAAETAAAPSTTLWRPGGGTETILLVEDEDVVRGLARTFLSQFGYEVLDAANPAAALKLAAAHPKPIHLVITDVVMPGMNGTQMVQQLAKTRPDTKVLFISGYPAEAARDLGMSEPGQGFLQKPFTSSDLSRKVREILDRASS